MDNKAILVIVIIISCILIVAGKNNQLNDKEFNILHKGINSLANVAVQYHKDFDMKVKFGALQEVLTIIDRAMLDYQGTAKEKLDEIRNLNSDAKLAYEKCVGPVFEWCVGANSTLDIIIKYLDGQELKDSDRDIIWNITLVLLKQGHVNVLNSITLLTDVQTQMSLIKNKLDSMLHDLHYDFSSIGFYGKEITILKDLQNERITIFVDSLIELINLLWNLFSFLFGLSKPLMITIRATLEQKIQSIKDFFYYLSEHITRASKLAAEIGVSLTEDKKNLHAMEGLIEGANRVSNAKWMNRHGRNFFFCHDKKKCLDWDLN